MEETTGFFGMGLFPHIYAIPLSVLVGAAIGYYLRGRLDSNPERPPQKPRV